MKLEPGPYWHVIRFLDHPLLPANAARDHPKIVKHGIDDDGPMHPKSPHVSGPDGVATLLYKMGRETWLERFLDARGTEAFSLELGCVGGDLQQIYVKRCGSNVELGFYSSDERKEPAAGMRYRIGSSGEFQPISTSDMGSKWGGSDEWVRGQGEAFAKHIWYYTRWSISDEDDLIIDWTGITEADKVEARAWVDENKKQTKEKEDAGPDFDMDSHMANRGKELMERRKKKIRACRNGCGVENTNLCCGKCKEVRYCSRKCQKEDWKYHKSVCGRINNGSQQWMYGN